MTITHLFVGTEEYYYVATRNQKIDRNVGKYHEKAN